MPAFYEPPLSITGGVPQLWIMASGGANWGGCDAYVSRDAINYVWIGRINTVNQQGLLANSLPASSDPDLTDTLNVDMVISQSALFTGVTSTDADQFNTASLIDQEVISYGTVTPTGAFTASLTYLRRGVYNTTPALHNSGAVFTRINPSTAIIWPLPLQYVGQTMYFKFTSFNVFGQAEEQLSAVVAYEYTPLGLVYSVKPPTNAVLTAGALVPKTMTLTWKASPDPGLHLYFVEWSLDGGSTWPITQTVAPPGTTAQLNSALLNQNYTARVAAQNTLNEQSTYATSATVNSGAAGTAVANVVESVTATDSLSISSNASYTVSLAESSPAIDAVSNGFSASILEAANAIDSVRGAAAAAAVTEAVKTKDTLKLTLPTVSISEKVTAVDTLH
jgi:hypothetical protein